MEAWLLNPCLVPKLTNSIPFSLTPSRKSKQSLEVPYRKLNLCGTGKNSTSSQVASMAGGMIYSAFLFRFYLKFLFRICSESEIQLTNVSANSAQPVRKKRKLWSPEDKELIVVVQKCGE